ncbi:MAG: tyrosine-protein phosphatase [Lachnospiraceae bacterium]
MRKRVLSLLLTGMMITCSVIPAHAGTAGFAKYDSPVITSKKNQSQAESISGTITEIEKYGHVVTDITIAEMPFNFGDILTIAFDNGFTLDAPYLPDYFVDHGEYLVRGYQGHTYVAVCVNYGKMNEVADIDVGSNVTISMKEKEGYLAQYEMYQLERTNDRNDYSSDEVFANFRPITVGNIADGVLYRSSSPVNPELGRAAYASALAEQAGIATFINLADSQENIAEYFAAEDFNSPYYKSVYDKGDVVCLNMPVSYTSADFKEKLGEGLIFMSEHKGPYLVHCNEGKDRAGFTSALLEALMGASLDEIRYDYMTSYVNYYWVERGSAKYELIQSKHLDVMLCTIAGVEKSTDLSTVDLAKGANDYMLSCGVSQAQIDTITANLSGE